MKLSKRLLEFKALRLKVTEEQSGHLIYFKEHSVREQSQDKPSGRTLFVVNVPPYADEKGLVNAFKCAGEVKSVQLCAKPAAADVETPKFLPQKPLPCFRVAYLVFNKVSELDKALKLTELCVMNSAEHQIKVGLAKWTQEHNSNVYQPKALKEKVESFMQHYDEELNKAEKKEKALEEEDDEGWITVTKKGKTQSFARTEKVENKILTKESNKRNRKELKNFYTFQIRESKMKHIVALRQKFEEDKKKIQQIKQSRRFKPF